jgi:hypothetical protein
LKTTRLCLKDERVAEVKVVEEEEEEEEEGGPVAGDRLPRVVLRPGGQEERGKGLGLWLWEERGEEAWRVGWRVLWVRGCRNGGKAL